MTDDDELEDKVEFADAVTYGTSGEKIGEVKDFEFTGDGWKVDAELNDLGQRMIEEDYSFTIGMRGPAYSVGDSVEVMMRVPDHMEGDRPQLATGEIMAFVNEDTVLVDLDGGMAKHCDVEDIRVISEEMRNE